MTRLTALLVFAAALLLPLTAPVAAQGMPDFPAAHADLHYRMVGPARGGRVTTVTGVPSQPRTFYMGVASARSMGLLPPA